MATRRRSDTELYAKLWSEVLQGDGPDFARTPDDACHQDFADYSTGAEEDARLWLEFYATEEERREWARAIGPTRRFLRAAARPFAATTDCRCATDIFHRPRDAP